ncbi:MAG: hypothetical protein OEY89_09325 [Gammaproteobacteria bacterium]|nr:hypothetical protein [Gammaproteobacteria bacterium]
MTISSYADYLVSRGETVTSLGGIKWMNYYGALIPSNAMPVYVDISRDDAVKLVKESNTLFLRYTTGPVESETNWWYMVCRNYALSDVSGNTRSKIRRGLQRLKIRPVTAAWLAKNGYDCHVRCYKRYKHASPRTEDDFRFFMEGLDGYSIFDFWACCKSDKLVGYIICLREKDGVFMHTIDISPEGLHDYSAYAMMHELLDHYVNGLGIPVSNGSRSIAHKTNMQDYLCKFGFEREYAYLHVVYRPVLRLLVDVLYPFRNVIRTLDVMASFHKVSSLLFQEEIVRTQTCLNLSYE